MEIYDNSRVVEFNNNTLNYCKSGEVTVKIISKNQSGDVTASDAVRLEIRENNLESIQVAINNNELNVEDTANISTIINPNNCTDDITIEYISSDSNIVTVDEEGFVEALMPGSATITVIVRGTNGDNTVTELSNVINIVVNEPEIITTGFTYELNSDDTYTIIGYGYDGGYEIVVPSVYNNKEVTSIADGVFANLGENAENITLKIPFSIKSIGAKFVSNSITTIYMYPDEVILDEHWLDLYDMNNGNLTVYTYMYSTVGDYNENHNYCLNIDYLNDENYYNYGEYTINYDYVDNGRRIVITSISNYSASSIHIPFIYDNMRVIGITDYALQSLGGSSDIGGGEEYPYDPEIGGGEYPGDYYGGGTGGASCTSIEISDGIETIGNEVFCENQLDYIELPSTLKSIGSYCFRNANTMMPSMSVTFKSINAEIDSECFSDTNGIDIYVYGYEGSTIQNYIEQLNNSNIMFGLKND